MRRRNLFTPPHKGKTKPSCIARCKNCWMDVHLNMHDLLLSGNHDGAVRAGVPLHEHKLWCLKDGPRPQPDHCGCHHAEIENVAWCWFVRVGLGLAREVMLQQHANEVLHYFDFDVLVCSWRGPKATLSHAFWFEECVLRDYDRNPDRQQIERILSSTSIRHSVLLWFSWLQAANHVCQSSVPWAASRNMRLTLWWLSGSAHLVNSLNWTVLSHGVGCC